MATFHGGKRVQGDGLPLGSASRGRDSEGEHTYLGVVLLSPVLPLEPQISIA